MSILYQFFNCCLSLIIAYSISHIHLCSFLVRSAFLSLLSLSLSLSLFFSRVLIFFSLVFLCSLFFREILSYINSSTFLAQELFFRSSWFHFPFLSSRFRLVLIYYCFSSFFENYILICLIALFFHIALLFSCFSSVSLFFIPCSFPFCLFFTFISSFLYLSLLILFFAPTFFLFYYSRFSFSRISRTDSLTTISLNSPPLSCLLDGSVYFERVVITPATIASLHCLLWSGDSVQSLRATQKGYPDSMETFARSKDRKW